MDSKTANRIDNNLLVSDKEQLLAKISGLEAINKLLNNRINRYDAVLNSIPKGIVIIEKDGSLVFTNLSAKQILDLELKDIPPEDWPETYGLFLEDGRTIFPINHFPILKAIKGEPYAIEEMLLISPEVKDKKWISLSAEPLVNRNDEIIGAMIFLEDITRSKLLENSRRRIELRTEALFAISNSIAEYGDDLNRILEAVAMHASKYIGDIATVFLLDKNGTKPLNFACYHPDAKVRMRIKEYMLSDDYDLNYGGIGGVIESGEPLLIPSIRPEQLALIANPVLSEFIIEYGYHGLLIVPIFYRKDMLGTITLVRNNDSQPFTSDDQSLLMEISRRTGLAIEHTVLIQSLRQEISERRNVERALSDSEARFKSIFETTSLGVKILDTRGKILQTNTSFSQMVGNSAEEMLGHHFSDYLYAEDVQMTTANFESLTSGKLQGYNLEHRLVDSDGSIVWVNTSFTAVYQKDDNRSPIFIFGIVENITKRKNLELEMREMKTHLQDNLENERLRLAQDIHDGPMQGLYSAIFQIETLRNNREVVDVDVISNVKDDIQTVIDELRATTQELRPPTLSDFGLEKAIRSHAEDIAEKYPQIKIRLSLAQDQQVLPENIRLALFRIYQSSITNTLRHAEATEVEIRFTYDVEEITYELHDNGKGFIVPERWVEFIRKEHYGLAGIAERVEMLDGKLTVKSAPGDGTIVRVVIPSRFNELYHQQ